LGDYLNYISKLVGGDAMLPVVFILALLGPIVVYRLVHNVRTGWLNKFKWFIAIITFFSCLILYIGTAGYIGQKYGFPALGMGLGLVAFYFSYNFFTSKLPSTCSIEISQSKKETLKSTSKVKHKLIE